MAFWEKERKGRVLGTWVQICYAYPKHWMAFSQISIDIYTHSYISKYAMKEEIKNRLHLQAKFYGPSGVWQG
jgi:hypothetical protein